MIRWWIKIYCCIDIFFTSLAAVKKEQAIGIIFSGTGADGTKGVRAIYEAGGIVMVQYPLDADYDSMPMQSISKPHQLANDMLTFVEKYAEQS